MVRVMTAVVLLLTTLVTRAADPEPIKIGALYPITGTGAVFGVPAKQGHEMAVAEINASGGINGRQIVTIARDTKTKPAPAATAGMSPGETTAAIRLIQQIRQVRDVTVLFTEHDMRVVFDIADRVSVLHHGEVIASDTPAKIRLHPEVRRVYLGSK